MHKERTQDKYHQHAIIDIRLTVYSTHHRCRRQWRNVCSCCCTTTRTRPRSFNHTSCADACKTAIVCAAFRRCTASSPTHSRLCAKWLKLRWTGAFALLVCSTLMCMCLTSVCVVCSATDNPMVFIDPSGEPGVGEILSGGNFHGEYPAKALDYLSIAVVWLLQVFF